MSVGRRFSLEAARRTRELFPNPPIFAPKNRPILSDSSPHVLMWDDFLMQFGSSEQRRIMINMLHSHLHNLKNHGITVDILLIGGSFVNNDAIPNDIDALIPYQIGPSCDIEQAIEFLHSPTSPELDVRYVPQDADSAIFIKMISFFTLLYSYDTNSNHLSKPVYILHI